MCKFLIKLFLAALLTCSAWITYGASTIRDFNYGWTFHLCDIDHNPDDIESIRKFDFKEVKVPHDWSIQEGYSTKNTAGSNGYLPGGVGWYKKNFSVDKKNRTKFTFIRFEGVYANSKVWINGNYLGFTPNGYLDFEYDLTPYLKFDQPNEIVMSVDRRAYSDSRWYVGGGIYRNTHLITREKSYILTHGVLITPKVNGSKATVEIQTSVVSKSKNLEYKFEVLNGKRVVTKSKSSNSQEQISIPNAQLWSLENPHMYTLRTTLYADGKVVDTRHDTFGIKNMVFDPDKGIFLNGKPIKIKGVNIHHDMGAMGVALYDDVLHRRLSKLKSVGCNAIRTAHNPHSESLLAMCDTMGFLVMNEFLDDWKVSKGKWITKRGNDDAPLEISVGYAKYFDDYAERDLKHFIRRDYNHPSVMMWSIGNEIEWTYPYYWESAPDRRGFAGLIALGTPESDNKKVLAEFNRLSKNKDELASTAHILTKWLKEVDTSRPVTSGIVIPQVSRVSGYTDALDIIGYNYKSHLYEYDHKKYPEKMIIGSENVGQYFEWKAVLDKDYIPGIFLWTGIDYIGENGPFPLKGALYSLFDFACHKTHRGHFFETMWVDTPKTYMVTTPASMSEFKVDKNGAFSVELRKPFLRRWEWFDVFHKWDYAKGETIIVQVYSNAPKVELLLNGKSLGTKNRSDFDDYNVITWDVPFVKGDLIAIGRSESGAELSRYTLRSVGNAVDIEAYSDREVIASDGYQLAHIELSLCDKDGHFVEVSDRTIDITLDDKLELLAVDNGSYSFVGDHQAPTIKSHNGCALAIIQPKRGAKGKATITFALDNGVQKVVEVRCK